MIYVSIIVPVFNDKRFIYSCIKSLQDQTYPKDLYEIIIIDDGSTDNTADIVKSFDGIIYIYQDNQGPSSARNKGINMAKGEFVAFTDSDCEVSRDWLERLIASFSNGVAGVGGAQIGHPDDNDFARKVDPFLRAIGFIGDYVKPYSKIKAVSHNASCNSAYKKSMILEVGGFREGLFPGEDVDLDKRLRDRGYKILFTPEAVVYHHRPDNRQRWHRMLMNYGKASADNLLIHGPFRLIQVVPIILPIMLLVVSLLFFINPILTAAAIVFFMLIAASALKLRSLLSLRDTVIFSSETMLLFCIGFWKRLFENMKKPMYRDMKLPIK